LIFRELNKKIKLAETKKTIPQKITLPKCLGLLKNIPPKEIPLNKIKFTIARILPEGSNFNKLITVKTIEIKNGVINKTAIGFNFILNSGNNNEIAKQANIIAIVIIIK